MAKLTANPKLANLNGWQDRHNQAVSGYHVRIDKQDLEAAIVNLLKAWSLYAEAHKNRYESVIGDDGFLGDYWQQIGDGIRGLLNGDCGPRLDCGTLDAFILDILAENGIDTEKL